MASKKLDIKVVLSNIDNNNYEYFDLMPNEDKKSISPWIIMRYLSSSSKYSELYLISVNEMVNKNFNICNKYTDLSLKTLCSVGIGAKQYHPWISPPKNGIKSNNSLRILHELHPEWNKNELELFISMHSHEELCQYFEECGVEIDE